MRPDQRKDSVDLGTNSKSRKHLGPSFDYSACFARLNYWHLQAVAREVLQEKSITCCCRSLIKNISNVSVIESSKKSYSLSGVMRCGSVWKCPICATKVTEKRRKDLTKGMEFILGKGAYSMMLTLTAPHYVNNSCDEVTTKISEALRIFYNREVWKGSKKKNGGFEKELGIIGRIRALEVTFTQKGWHPHFHTILLSDKELPPDKYESTTRAILTHWQSCCVAAGLPKPNEHGVQLCNGSKVAKYISKWGISESSFTEIHKNLAGNDNNSWGIEAEMVKGFMKKGTNVAHIAGVKSYSPFGILQKIADINRDIDKLIKTGNFEEASTLKNQSSIWANRFREYVKCFKGRRQLIYSKGLRLKMDLDSNEKSDEELVYEKEDGSRVFATIPIITWKAILSQEMRGQLLEACRQGMDYLEAWIQNILEADKLGNNKKEKNTAFRMLQQKKTIHAGFEPLNKN